MFKKYLEIDTMEEYDKRAYVIFYVVFGLSLVLALAFVLRIESWDIVPAVAANTFVILVCLIAIFMGGYLTKTKEPCVEGFLGYTQEYKLLKSLHIRVKRLRVWFIILCLATVPMPTVQNFICHRLQDQWNYECERSMGFGVGVNVKSTYPIFVKSKQTVDHGIITKVSRDCDGFIFLVDWKHGRQEWERGNKISLE